MQSVLKSAFGTSTVLTIAHRLHTIVDHDRIFVLDEGKVVEAGTPIDLARTEGGIFQGMLVKADIDPDGIA